MHSLDENKLSKWRFLCQPVQIYSIIRVIEDDGGITFLATDNKNCVFTGVDDNGVCSRFVHTELEIKIVIHGSLLPSDILHHLRGRQWL